MTNKEIFDGNVLIAEFMGEKFIAVNSESLPRLSFKQKFKTYSGCASFCETKNKIINEPKNYFPMLYKGEMQYHSSWDWLMPVVEKINYTTTPDEIHDIIIYKNTVHVNDSSEIMFEHNRTKESEAMISIVFKAIVDFIKWYNENKPTK